MRQRPEELPLAECQTATRVHWTLRRGLLGRRSVMHVGPCSPMPLAPSANTERKLSRTPFEERVYCSRSVKYRRFSRPHGHTTPETRDVQHHSGREWTRSCHAPRGSSLLHGLKSSRCSSFLHNSCRSPSLLGHARSRRSEGPTCNA